MMMHRIAGGLLAAVLSCGLPAHEGDDHGEEQPPPGGRVLGALSFPTSTSVTEAQQAFERGMLLLHLFEYPFARDEFRLAQELDPDFAMAYWGEAMTHNHPIWDEQDRHSARAVMAALGATPDERLARSDAPREKGLLAAIEVLFGPGTKAERDQKYMRAMELLAASYPEDHEIQLFYALSIMGVHAGVRDTAAYMMVTAIAQSVFSDNPRHPGAAHYLIHGVDDPVHAVLGLEAARALAVMAPDAGHSLHMTSHIFTALGMWKDVVAANEAAVRVQNAMRQERGEAVRHWGHYNYWLLYGYLQQGRHEAARKLLLAARADLDAHGKPPDQRMILDPDRDITGSVVQMWARYLIETRDWSGDIADWTFRTADAYDPNLTFAFIQALRAGQDSRASGVTTWLQQFQNLANELAEAIGEQDEQAPTDLLFLKRLAVMEQEMLSVYEMARGEKSRAVVAAREASRLEGEMPFSFGPPFVDLPAAEWLGEMLLAAGEPEAAAQALELQLERSRQKSTVLRSLIDACLASGQAGEAVYRREQLERIWAEADDGLRAALSEPARR